MHKLLGHEYILVRKAAFIYVCHSFLLTDDANGHVYIDASIIFQHL